MQTPQTGETAANLKANLYETDFYAWTQQQSHLLRGNEWNQLDLPNLIEEIEALGRKERQELRNRLSVLIGHLLKWEFQSAKRSRSWLNTIRIQRLDTWELLEENPSLQAYLQEILIKAYMKAIALAMGETNLPMKTFPSDCPYTIEQILSDRFYPGKATNDDLME
ncbi:DUF29 domain-containing protein [Nodularia sphaerocarpa]|uniref:DUF29 domain-containing protein n=2 Tax=Nodularia sphaerocarpa TaxID=137816 RepID=UPI001EFAC83C|nr:DUF29 domain-containing protein [Nodularia sphaerocarpa]MDB9375094.1 DUF29 domain-containing protein [Nodularia sphaerocarpa CS-585]ULP73293.1 hypothetical protein BDGGKGIB_02946 [Nodularia sphaerocarpa UHCC 0038]